MSTPALAVEGLGFRRGGAAVLSGASFALAPGEAACLQGASGAGKTTLLRLLAGLEAPSEGTIRLGGRPASEAGRILLEPRERGIGWVPQGLALWPHMTAAEHAAFPLTAKGESAAAAAPRAAELLESLGIAALSARRPHELSGGERQRVALARALACAPRLLLLDEPMSGLDEEAKDAARRLVLAVAGRSGAALLWVTHDPREAAAVSPRVMRVRDGRLAAAA